MLVRRHDHEARDCGHVGLDRRVQSPPQAHPRPNRSLLKLNRVIIWARVPSPEDPRVQFKYHAERLVAAIVTQTCSYMVESGTQYGYTTTGEAFVFLLSNWGMMRRQSITTWLNPTRTSMHRRKFVEARKTACIEPSQGLQCSGPYIGSRRYGIARASHRNPQRMGGGL